ncbi:hypothetical protein GCM10010406_51650 [Streptomyces thermolineatus]|uniref:Uncharacterized protein n=1 Tax=Streptomyces thermolineatus TaxID=44033 RepID=A0ABN3MV41_9ACTN
MPLGREGMPAVTNRSKWRAVPPYPVAGNPTGTGDTAPAAPADGTAERRPWPERLRTAVASSAAAVAAPLASRWTGASGGGGAVAGSGLQVEFTRPAWSRTALTAAANGALPVNAVAKAAMGAPGTYPASSPCSAPPTRPGRSRGRPRCGLRSD